MVRILQGDCRDVLRTLPSESVHCCVTSPPYFGLRDYGHEGQIGLEPTPAEFVAKLVEVFREVRRVLRDDGTLWLNLGDSYASNAATGTKVGGESYRGSDTPTLNTAHQCRVAFRGDGIKAKDLIGIPWRVAFALQADGWWLRQDIIWQKKNPMPESVTDRCTKSHEYVFLLAKSRTYYYDAVAVKEAYKETTIARNAYSRTKHVRQSDGSSGGASYLSTKANGEKVMIEANDQGRNKRDVWTIATKPYRGAHFAVFPAALVEPCILAGTSEKGCCKKCGAPWERVTEREDQGWDGSRYGERAVDATGGAISGGTEKSTLGSSNGKLTGKTKTTGWRPTCDCNEYDMHLPPDDPAYVPLTPVPCTVLDPFGGSGTTGEVAEKYGRDSILIELNPSYVELAKRRTIKRVPAREPPAGEVLVVAEESCAINDNRKDMAP